jgi:hypothetical protein
MATVFNVPWYATGFRGDAVEEALQEIAPVALRYGASDWAIYRYTDDRYKFMQFATFDDKDRWQIYWYGPEFTDWRMQYSSWFQVPILYQPMRLVNSGRIGENGNGNGAAAVSPARAAPS